MAQQQSDFQPLMEDDEEFRVRQTEDGVKVVFRAHDGTERIVPLPMHTTEPVQQRRAA